MNPEVTLDSLSKKSRVNCNYKHQRLYRNLYKKEFYYHAYGEMSSKTGNMTAGTDGKTIDGFSLELIDKLIECLKDESYQPMPASRTYIPKKGKKGKRPLGIPAIVDKLVQKVVAYILESIYEPIFMKESHGFRPNRSCHTALQSAKINFQGVTWFIEGDIKGFFDNIDHDIMIQLLQKRIDDERFLRLIRKFLNAGYIEDWKFHNTYTGTPQGGIISPLLANIYLHELDEYIIQYKLQFDLGKTRKANNEYKKYGARIQRDQKKLQNGEVTENERNRIIENIKNNRKAMINVPAKDPYDKNYKRLQYVRYADDFLIGVIGSKDEAESVKDDIRNFLKQELKLELSMEKTLITNATKPAKFLSYELFVIRNATPRKVETTEGKTGKTKRTKNGMVMLKMPSKVIRDKLLEYRAIKVINQKEKKEIWKPSHRSNLLHLNTLEIFLAYNAEIRGLYNYYNLAYNVSYLHKFAHNMKYSLANTLAGKFRKHRTDIFKKYRNYNNGEFGIYYNTKSGRKFLPFYNEGFKMIKEGNKDDSVNELPNTLKFSDYVGVVKRLLAEKCEWCGAENVPLEVHHIKKVKDLKGKKRWEKVMIARKRKTLTLCLKCHDDLHAGKLD